MNNLILTVVAFLISFNIQASEENFQLDDKFANRFAKEWIASWNSHDLENILTHYTDDFTMNSPSIIRLGLSDTGTLQGKAAMRDYWGRSLGTESQIKMELIDTLLGVNSITIYYRSVHRSTMAAEVFVFGKSGLVIESSAHYSAGTH